MTQTGRNPHGYNPMNYQRHYQWARSCLLCQLDSSHLLINVSNRTRSQLVCFYENIITLNTVIKAEFLYQLTYISLVYIRFGYLRA